MPTNNRRRLLAGATATGGGSWVVLTEPVKDHTIEIDFSNSGGSATAISVGLNGRLSSSGGAQLTLKTFSAAELSAGKALHTVCDFPVTEIQAEVVTLTDTGTTTINVNYLGVSS